MQCPPPSLLFVRRLAPPPALSRPPTAAPAAASTPSAENFEIMPSVVPWKAYKNEHYRARGFTVAGPEAVAVRRRAAAAHALSAGARSLGASCGRAHDTGLPCAAPSPPSLPARLFPQGWPAVPPPAGAAAYPEIFQHLGVRVNPADVLNHGPVCVARALRGRRQRRRRAWPCARTPRRPALPPSSRLFATQVEVLF